METQSITKVISIQTMAIILKAPCRRAYTKNATLEPITRDISVQDQVRVEKTLQEAMDTSGAVQEPKLRLEDTTTALAKVPGLDLPLDFRRQGLLTRIPHMARYMVKALLWVICLTHNMDLATLCHRTLDTRLRQDRIHTWRCRGILVPLSA